MSRIPKLGKPCLISIPILMMLTVQAFAIIGGSDDIDSPAANAVVSVGSCTGTLILPRVVLSAQHCIGNVPESSTAELRNAGSGPITFEAGNIFIYAGPTLDANGDVQRPAQILARTVEAPFWRRSDMSSPGQPKFIALAPSVDHPDIFIAAIDDRQLIRVNITTQRRSRTTSLPFQISALATVGSSYYASARNGRFYVSDQRMTSWRELRRTNSYRAMTSIHGRIFAITNSGRLFAYDPMLDIWELAGDAPQATSLTSIGHNLFMQTSDGKIWIRSAVPWPQGWEHWGGGLPGTTGQQFTAMTILGDRFFASDDKGRHIRSRIRTRFRTIGNAPNLISLTAHSGHLLGLTDDNKVFRRPASFDRVPWQEWGSGGGTKKIAALPLGLLIGVGSVNPGRLVKRSWVKKDSSWIVAASDRNQPRNIGAMDALPNGQIFIMDPVQDQLLVRQPGFRSDASYQSIMPRGSFSGIALSRTQYYGLIGGKLWRRPRRSTADYWIRFPEFLAPPGIWQSYAARTGAQGPQIRFGQTRSRRTTIRARDFMIIGDSDIVLMRLPTAVSPSLALPAAVITTNPFPSNSDWQGVSFRLSGWGLTQVPPPRINPDTRQATIANGAHIWPARFAGDGYVTWHQVTILRGSGGISMEGDSGGPLLWRPNAAIPWRVIGVASIGGGGTSETFVLTFHQPQQDNYNYVRPATGPWLAAVIRASNPRDSFFSRFLDGT